MAGAYLSVGDFDCHRGRIMLPRRGIWSADCVIEPTSSTNNEPQPGDAITLTIANQVTLMGTVRRIQPSNQSYGTLYARIVGGAGGFPTAIPPIQYEGTTLMVVLNDILSVIGETLSGMANNTDLSMNLPFWTRTQGPAFMAMANLMQEIAPDNWRILPDGTTWIGPESWPQTAMTQYHILSFAPQELKAQVASDTPLVMPGTGFMGGMVSTVEHFINDDKVWMNVMFEDPELFAAEAG